MINSYAFWPASAVVKAIHTASRHRRIDLTCPLAMSARIKRVIGHAQTITLDWPAGSSRGLIGL
jgi:hypothetical protein